MYQPYISPAQAKAHHSQLMREAAQYRQAPHSGNSRIGDSLVARLNGRLATATLFLRRVQEHNTLTELREGSL